MSDLTNKIAIIRDHLRFSRLEGVFDEIVESIEQQKERIRELNDDLNYTSELVDWNYPPSKL